MGHLEYQHATHTHVRLAVLQLQYFFHLRTFCLIFNSPCKSPTSYPSEKYTIIILSRQFSNLIIMVALYGMYFFKLHTKTYLSRPLYETYTISFKINFLCNHKGASTFQDHNMKQVSIQCLSPHMTFSLANISRLYLKYNSTESTASRSLNSEHTVSPLVLPLSGPPFKKISKV